MQQIFFAVGDQKQKWFVLIRLSHYILRENGVNFIIRYIILSCNIYYEKV